MNSVRVLGLNFQGAHREAVETAEPGRCKFIVTVNADFVVRAREGDERLRRIIDDNISTFDGFWPWLVARVRRRDQHCDKISGSDLIYSYAQWCRTTNSRLLIMGGGPGVAADAAKRLGERSGYEGCFAWEPPFEDYPMSDAYVSAFRKQIEDLRPSVLAVCLGSPKQEYFIEDQLAFLSTAGVSFAYGAGGTVDFVAGRIKRAPVPVQRIGLEGVWRLFSQPSLFRLKRLLLSLKIFRYCLD